MLIQLRFLDGGLLGGGLGSCPSFRPIGGLPPVGSVRSGLLRALFAMQLALLSRPPCGSSRWHSRCPRLRRSIGAIGTPAPIDRYSCSCLIITASRHGRTLWG